MLFALLLILIRRARRTRRIRIACDLEYRNSPAARKDDGCRGVPGWYAWLLIPTQAQNRGYKVMRSGSEIGWVSFIPAVDSLSTFISMASQIPDSGLVYHFADAKRNPGFRGG